jgi:hypothetical protein
VPEDVPAAKQRANPKFVEEPTPVLTVEESVDNQKVRLAEIALKTDSEKQLQFSAHSHRIKFRFADAKGNAVTEWSRDYRAREMAEKSDAEVLRMLRAFHATNSDRRVA